MRPTQFEGAEGNCTNGGVKIEVLVDGSVDDAQTQYICNGAQGAQGQGGTNTSIQTTAFEGEQGNCTNGGIKIEALIDGVVQDDQTRYICNGDNGVDGNDGQDGQNGHNALVATSDDVGSHCDNGGIRVDTGLDSNNNGTLEANEILSSSYICNGTDGQNGTNASIDSESFEGEQNGCTNGGIKLTIHNEGQADQVQYVCNGLAECVSDNGCRETTYCDLTTHICIEKKAFGESCTQSNHCIDGICIDDNVCSGNVGDKITFGYYEQNGDTTDGKEPIKWRILETDKEDRRLLLLSEYVLDAQAYHTSSSSITWENCSLRSWLNSTFLNDAFSETEQAMIQTTHLTNPNNLNTNVAGGNDTDDKIFLLGLSDVYGEDTNYSAGHWYFNSSDSRIEYETKYTVVNRSFGYAYLDGSDTKCTLSNYTENRCSAPWWLRSPGYSSGDAANVNRLGNVAFFGYGVNDVAIGIRPALWVQY